MRQTETILKLKFGTLRKEHPNFESVLEQIKRTTIKAGAEVVSLEVIMSKDYNQADPFSNKVPS